LARDSVKLPVVAFVARQIRDNRLAGSQRIDGHVLRGDGRHQRGN
jgi:hypothetical protein